MEQLSCDFALGWDINQEKLDNLRNDLQELGTVDIHFYKSKFSLLSSFPTQIKYSEPAEPSESNHVDILLNGKVVTQFFRRVQGFRGILFDEHIPEPLQQGVGDILAKYKYYTTR